MTITEKYIFVMVLAGVGLGVAYLTLLYGAFWALAKLGFIPEDWFRH